MVDEARVAVVTGGGRGIGRGIVLALADMGFALVVNYRSDLASAQSACELAEKRRRARAGVVRADIGRLAQGRQLLETAIERHGRIDLWVNNAGIAPERRLDLLETTPESWDRLLETNLRGPFFLTQSVAKAMIAMLEAGTISEPQIVFITSISSRSASVNRGEYCVSKAGLAMAAQLFAVRLAGAGIRVYEIRPGLIETDMTEGVHEAYSARIADGIVPIPRWGTPEDVGRAVAAIAGNAFAYSTGLVLEVDGGMSVRKL